MIFGGKFLVGLGIAGLAVGGAAGLPGLMLAAAISAIGGPMGDIPLAVLRQTELPQGEIAAATRAFMTMSYLGTLTAMLIAPGVAAAVGPVWLIIGCGGAMMSLAVLALTRFT
jgi:hypothetical protein